MRGSNHQLAPLEKARPWLSGPHRQCAVWLLSGYYEQRFGGARFDDLAGGGPADAITEDDLAAVRSLSIGFPRAFVDDLRGDDAQSRIRSGLAKIPPDIKLEDLSRADFDRFLGPESSAWQLWVDLAASLRRFKARAPLVGASKLLAAKRPQLVPLEDSYVRRALGSSRRDIWQTIHQIVRDPEASADLTAIRQQVTAASHITLHRTLDVIIWRGSQGHDCSQHATAEQA
jgi:hypothetical protein